MPSSGRTTLNKQLECGACVSGLSRTFNFVISFETTRPSSSAQTTRNKLVSRKVPVTVVTATCCAYGPAEEDTLSEPATKHTCCTVPGRLATRKRHDVTFTDVSKTVSWTALASPPRVADVVGGVA